MSNSSEAEEPNFGSYLQSTEDLWADAFQLISELTRDEEESGDTPSQETEAAAIVIHTLANKFTTLGDELQLVNGIAGPSGSQVTPADNTTINKAARVRRSSQGSSAYGIVSKYFKANTVTVNVTQVHQVGPTRLDLPVETFRNAPAPFNMFTGRKELLESIHNKLQECLPQQHFMNRIVAVVGMGGMGKSESAKKLAAWYKDHYVNVAWIDAETEESAKASFQKLCRRFNLSHSSDDEGKDLAERVFRHVGEHYSQTALFIFDNANQLKTRQGVFGIYDYLPTQQTVNLPLILLTSQTTEWSSAGCEVIPITWLSTKEATEFLLSRFRIQDQHLERNKDLKELFKILMKKLNGYPLALGLAAANISFIPGQGSLALLKTELRSYIQLVDDNKILDQRADDHLAVEYPRTLMKVWGIAMANLERQKHGREAKHLLFVLAYISQKDLDVFYVNGLYNERSKMFGISFPEDTDASSQQALNDLQTVGLAILERRKDEQRDEGRARDGEFDEGYYRATIKVHRLVQSIARRSDHTGIGIRKIILHELGKFDARKVFGFCWPMKLNEKHLWSEDCIPGWVLQNERNALLWVQGLWQKRMNDEGNRNWNSQTQLQKFENGGDMALVAKFLTGDDREILGKALQIRADLHGPTPEIRVFLDFLLLLVTAKYAYRKEEIKSRAWLSDFDYTTVLRIFCELDDDQRFDNAVDILEKASVKLAKLDPDSNRVGARALFRLAYARLVVFMEWYRPESVLYFWEQRKTARELLISLTQVLDPENAEELLRDNLLADSLALVLNFDCESIEILYAMRLFRDVALKPNCVHILAGHERLMQCLESVFVAVGSSRPDTATLNAGLYRIDEYTSETRNIGPYAPGCYKSRNVFIIYHAMITYSAIYATVTSRKGNTRPASVVVPSREKAQDVTSWLSAYKFFVTKEVEFREIRWTDREHYRIVNLTKEELEGDAKFLDGVLQKLEGEGATFRQGDWGKFLLSSLPLVQKLNSHFISAFNMSHQTERILREEAAQKFVL